MATSRDTVQLLIEILGQDGLDKLAQAAERASGAAKKAAQSYEVLDTVINKSVGVVGTYEIATDRANVALDEMVKKAVEATLAQKAMAQVMADLPPQAKGAFGQAADAVGEFAKTYRREILDAGRITQDFAQGGIGGILNNIEGMLRKFPALAGIGTILGTALWAAWPQIQQWFGEFNGQTDKAKEKVDELQAELAKIMKSRPFQERETAGLVEEFFAEEGPDQIVGGLASALSQSGQGAAMTPQERERLKQLRGFLGGSDDERVRTQIRNAEGEIRQRITDENRRMAGEMVANAPSNVASRRRIRELAQQFPRGLPANFAAHLAELEPEAVARQDEEVDEAESRGQRMIRAGEKRRANNKEVKKLEDENAQWVEDVERKDRQDAARRDKELTEQGERNELATERQKAAQERKDAAQAARAARAAPREARARRKRQVEGQADELLAHGPEIVGQAFGPQAAMMAGQANPAEIQEMREQTIRNLNDAQPPYEALLNAFRDVQEASARNARQTRQFYGQFSGMTGRMQQGLEQTPMPSGLQR
jgi:hypothetical protein